MTALDTHRAIEAVWQIESARLIAGLARIVRDAGLAEDLARGALWPWLERCARRGAGLIDLPAARWAVFWKVG